MQTDLHRWIYHPVFTFRKDIIMTLHYNFTLLWFIPLHSFIRTLSHPRNIVWRLRVLQHKASPLTGLQSGWQILTSWYGGSTPIAEQTLSHFNAYLGYAMFSL